MRLALFEATSFAVWLVFWITIGWIVGEIVGDQARVTIPVLAAAHGVIVGVVFVLLTALAYGKRHEVLAMRAAIYAVVGGMIYFVTFRLLLRGLELSIYIPLIVLPVDAAVGSALSLFLFRSPLGIAVYPIRTLRNQIASLACIIIIVIAVAISRAPDSAKHAYAWAVRKTLSPITSMQELDNFKIDESEFNAPKAYYPEDTVVMGGGILKWFREPSIYEDAGHPAIRLLYDRSFYDPVMVRLSYENGKWFLIAKRLTGGIHIPIHLDLDKKVPVSESLVNHLKKSLDRIGFWSMAPEIENIGCDGATWTLEARLDGRYHVVDRWSPEDKDEYKKLCVWLLKEGGVDDGPLF